jgi:hypothetical protein
MADGTIRQAAWTPERRARQAQLIATWRPWERSTGPRTVAGKAASSRNAYRGGGLRAYLREVREFLRETNEFGNLFRRGPPA